VLLAYTLTAYAVDPVDVTLDQFAAIKLFALGPIGYSGETSKGEAYFRSIARRNRQEALAAFEKLYVTGSPEAKLYALAGIKELSQARFVELKRTAKNVRGKIAVASGCFYEKEEFRAVVQKIDNGDFQLYIDHDFSN
jgi:hypothetical protein